MNEIRWGVSLVPEEANACGERGNALRGRLQVLANVWGKGCKRLRERLQCFASEKGKTGTEIVSPILDKRKRRRDTPLTSHCSPPLMYLVIPDSTSSMEKSIKTVIRRYWRDFKTETSLTWMPSVCCASVQRLRIFSSYHSGDVSVPQGVNRNELDQLLCSHP